MSHYAVSVIGRDRPGIVAALSGALLEVEGNIEDSRMAILRGHFAVMLIVAAPDGIDRVELEARLGPLRDQLGLEAISVGEVAEIDASSPAATHVLTVYGADHPGIVHAIATALAERGANITDLQTRLMGSDEKPLYVMMIELSLSDDGGVEGLEQELLSVGERAKVDVSLRRLEVEAL